MHDLPDALLDEVADRFRLLGDPTRLRILRAILARGEASVGELAAATGCSQANVSKHLRLLLDGRMVRRRQAGTSAYYRLADPGVEELCELACGVVRRQVAAEAARIGLVAGGGT